MEFPTPVIVFGRVGDKRMKPDEGINLHLDNGRIVDLLDDGSGEPFLWLHSGFRGRNGLATLVNQVRRDLKKKGIQARHILPNMMGFGRSSPASQPGLDPHEIATDISDLLATMDLRNVHLVGYSMGANVGTVVANRDPKRFRDLTLIASAIEGANLEVYRWILGAHDKQDWVGIARFLADNLVGSQSRESYLKLLPLLRKQVSSGSFRDDLKRILDSGTRFAIFPEIKSLSVPTLLISGSEDPFAPDPSKLLRLEDNQNLRVTVLPGVGHNDIVFPRQVNLVEHLYEFWGLQTARESTNG